MALYILALITLFIVVALGVKTQMDNARRQKLDAIAFRQKLIDAIAFRQKLDEIAFRQKLIDEIAFRQKLDEIAFRQKLIDAQLEILKKEEELIDKRYSDNEQRY